jgi:hypothetical protein
MKHDEAISASRNVSFDYWDAFCDGVRRFRDEWDPAAPDFSVDVSGRRLGLSDLCRVIRGVGGQLPKDVLDRLLSDMHNERYIRRKTELARDPSYSTAADCLLMLITDGRAALRRLDEERFRSPGLKLRHKRDPNNGSA